MKENNFFKARNTINVYINNEKKELSSETELEAIIENEKKAIIDNPNLISAFNNIDAVMSKHKNFKELREYLEVHREILPELVRTILLMSFSLAIMIKARKTRRGGMSCA